MKTKFLLVVIVLLIGSRNVTAQEPSAEARGRGSPPEARIVSFNGKVEIKSAGEHEWQPAIAGTVMVKDTVISTGIRSSAVISLSASTITVSPVTILTLEELIRRDNTEEAILNLRTGRIRADVTPPAGLKSEFTVRSPATTASVRGTSFTFNGRRLVVHSGRVAFANNSGQTVYVNENQRSYAETGRQERLALPFEAASADLRPRLSDLDDTGSQRETPQSQTSQVNITLDWSE